MADQTTASVGASLSRNFAWSFIGTVAYNLSQWLLLVGLAQLGTRDMVGQFALALAISAPVFLTIGLNLRVVRATDVTRVWSARQYNTLRQVLNLAALMVTMLIGFGFGLRNDGLTALLFVCCSKSVEATSQVLYGFFQLRERLDLVSRSLLGRTILGPLLFLGGLAAFESLPIACLGLAIGWFLVFLVHDAPAHARLIRDDIESLGVEGLAPVAARGTLVQLSRKAFPLGLDAGVTSVAFNVPRYAVQLSFGTAHLGTFAALSYLSQIVAMVTGTLGDAVLARLAKLHVRQESAQFRTVILWLLGFGMAVTALATLCAALAGRRFMSSVMGADYVNQPVLIILMLGAGLITFQQSLAKGLYAAHRYTSALLVNAVILVAAIALVAVLMPMFGLMGAAATLGLAFLIGSVVTLIFLSRAQTPTHGRNS